ncbi:MAG: general secretion pathway protein GspK [Nitrospinales bacterium]
MKKPEQNQKGIALMLVLWIMVLLSALATEFAYSMRTEVATMKNYKEDVESYYLAKAGVNLALAELFQPARFHSIHKEYGFIVGKPLESKIEAGAAIPDQPPDQPPEQTSEQTSEQTPESASEPTSEPTSEPASETGEEDQVFEIVERRDIPLGNGTIHYKITDENGKININTASRELLIKVLTVSGLEIGEERDVIADSILDWIDSDDTHRLNGAENNHYNSLFPSYSAKNGFFDSVDELLKVRGVSQEIFYGTPEEDRRDDLPFYWGLKNFFTIQDIKIFNPNTADPAVLPVFYTPDQVEKILAAREEKGFYSNTLSTHFLIESTGQINDSQTTHTIVAIFKKFGLLNDATLLSLYWNDNVVAL